MNVMCGIRLSPFQGLYFCYPMYTGRCPVLLLMPFQGKLVIHFYEIYKRLLDVILLVS